MIELAPQHKRGLVLRAPLMNAAGILGFAGEYRGLLDFARLGALVTNPLTWNPRTPAAPPNIAVLPDGVLIHTGLPNPGLRAALRRCLREWARLDVPIIVHLAATTLADVRRSFDLLERVDVVSGVELGFRDETPADEMVSLIRAAVGSVPIIARLPVARAAEVMEAALRAGADALTVGAPPRMPFADALSEDEEPPAQHTGRAYSPSQFPIALAAVRAVTAQQPGVPVIGAGGIFSMEQAREMLAAGAVAVQLDAVLWQNPNIIRDGGLEIGTDPVSNL